MFTHLEMVFLQETERRLEQATSARQPVRRRASGSRHRLRRALRAEQRPETGRGAGRAGPAARRPAGTLASCAASGGEAW